MLLGRGIRSFEQDDRAPAVRDLRKLKHGQMLAQSCKRRRMVGRLAFITDDPSSHIQDLTGVTGSDNRLRSGAKAFRLKSKQCGSAGTASYFGSTIRM